MNRYWPTNYKMLTKSKCSGQCLSHFTQNSVFFPTCFKPHNFLINNEKRKKNININIYIAHISSTVQENVLSTKKLWLMPNKYYCFLILYWHPSILDGIWIKDIGPIQETGSDVRHSNIPLGINFLKPSLTALSSHFWAQKIHKFQKSKNFEYIEHFSVHFLW